MDVAADAVFDLAAPPPRAARQGAPADGAGSAIFEQHLDAGVGDATNASDVQLPQEGAAAKASQSDSDAGASGAELAVTVAAAPAAPDQPPPQIVVQLIASQPAQAPASSPAPASAAAPIGDPAAPRSAPAGAQSEEAAPIVPAPSTSTSDGAANIKSAPAASSKTAESHTPSNPAAAVDATAAAPSASANPIPQTASAPTSEPTLAAAPQQTVATDASSKAIVATAIATTSPAHAAPLSQPKSAVGQRVGATQAPQDDSTDQPQLTPPTMLQRRAASTGSAQPSGPKDIAVARPEAAEPMAPQPAAPHATAAAQSASRPEQIGGDHAASRVASAVHQVTREIVRRFDGGNTRFEMRLDPPELGRVEVRLDVSRDHRVTAVISADNPQAVTEMARHARELEQMLQNAGLELADNGLSFDLRQGHEQAETSELGNEARAGSPVLNDDAAPAPARLIGYERWRGVRLDMMV